MTDAVSKAIEETIVQIPAADAYAFDLIKDKLRLLTEVSPAHVIVSPTVRERGIADYPTSPSAK